MAIEDILRRNGVPFRTVLVPGAGVERLIADPRIAAVTLTGSSEVGERVASAAGRHLKKQVLELGGCGPLFVPDDRQPECPPAPPVRPRDQNHSHIATPPKDFIVTERVDR